MKVTFDLCDRCGEPLPEHYTIIEIDYNNNPKYALNLCDACTKKWHKTVASYSKAFDSARQKKQEDDAGRSLSAFVYEAHHPEEKPYEDSKG